MKFKIVFGIVALAMMTGCPSSSAKKEALPSSNPSAAHPPGTSGSGEGGTGSGGETVPPAK